MHPAAARGLDPEADFTTVFIGQANDWIFGGGLYGIASDIDPTPYSSARISVMAPEGSPP